MPNPIARYTHWLHTMWPAGTVEKLPDVREDGTTAVPGVRIVGDLTGIPLLKFSSDTGARAVLAILAEPDFAKGHETDPELLDLAIIGAGVSGIAAAMEAKKVGLSFQIFEATELFSTVVNFPKGKPIYTYPTDMTPAGDLQFKSEVHPKEELLETLESYRRKAGIEPIPARIERIERKGAVLLLHHGDKKTVTRARRVIVAIGRSGNHRKLGVPGEDLDKVFNRLYDPKEFVGRKVIVVGGGDSALETAIALGNAGAHVTVSYRKKEFARPKPENVEKLKEFEKNPSRPVDIEEPSSERVTAATGAFMVVSGEKPHAPGSVQVALGTQVVRVQSQHVVLKDEAGKETTIANDVVFTMLGREAPLEFFRQVPHPHPRRVDRRDLHELCPLFPVLRLPLQLEGRRRRQPVLPEAESLSLRHGRLVPESGRRRRRVCRRSQDFSGDARDLAQGSRLLLFTRLLRLRSHLRNSPHPPPQDPLCHRADDHAHRGAMDSALSPPLPRPAASRATTASSTADSERPSRITSSPPPTTAMAASTGVRSVSSSPGRSSSGTSSRRSRCGGGSRSRSFRPSSSSRS